MPAAVSPQPRDEGPRAERRPSDDRRPDDRRRRDEPRPERRGTRDEPAPTPGHHDLARRGLLPRRPRREDHVPVSAAKGTLEGTSDPQNVPQRHADFTTWQPAAEEGDDEPILGAGEERLPRLPVTPGYDPRPYPPLRAARGARRPSRRATPFATSDNGAERGRGRGQPPAASDEGGERNRGRGFPPPPAAASPFAEAGSTPRAAAPADVAGAEGDPADFAEIYVNVGRRDGARAADFQQILTERAGLDRSHVRRIRVRERNAFVSVRRDDLPRALAALGGASIAGKPAMAEQARERSGDGDGSDAQTLIPAAPDAAGAAVAGEPAAEAAATAEHLAPATPEALPSGDAADAGAEPVSSDDGVPTGRCRSE